MDIGRKVAFFVAILFATTLSPSHSSSAAEGALSLRFATHVEGQKLPDDLRDTLKSAIRLGTGNAPPPATLGQLRVRAQEDAKRLDDVLRSEAYYNARVETSIQEGSAARYDVVFRVMLGRRTMIDRFAIGYVDHPSNEAELPQEGKALGLKEGRAARAQRIIDLTDAALTYLRNHGHPRPELADRKVIIDLATQKADISLRIKAGRKKTFGPITIVNDGRTDPDYVRSFTTFKPGEVYDRRKVDESVAELRKSGLFEQVVLETQESSEQVEVQQITLVERPARSIGAGASWSSSDGAGLRGLWEHRNLLGGGEKLNVTLTYSQLKKSALAEFRRPRFLREDQSLLANLEIADEHTDAYDEKRIRAGAGLSRKLTEELEASLGGSFEFYRTQDDTGLHNYRLFGIPFNLRYDGSNDLLEPTKGFRGALSLAPYAGTADGSAVTFGRIELSGSTYLGITQNLIVALRMRYGSMLAKGAVDVPGSLRFYAGGGGSVRGYAYQEAGPLDADGDPIGGRAAVELSAEARYRVNKSIGLVAFIDGGRAYESMTPKLNEAPLWGAGIGARYYTAIGPVRADVAVPLNRRRGVDSAVQFYFSLGQAF